MKRKDKERFVSVCAVIIMVFSQCVPIFAQTIQLEPEQIVDSSENLGEEPESGLEEPPKEEEIPKEEENPALEESQPPEVVEEVVEEATKETVSEEPKAPEAPMEVLAEEEPSAPSSKETDAVTTGTWGTAPWSFDEATGVVTIEPGKLATSYTSPWNGSKKIPKELVKKIIFQGTTVLNENSSYSFGDSIAVTGLPNLVEIQGMEFLDTSQVTTMDRMFYGCSSLKELNLSSFNTENVTNMQFMFRSCFSLEELDLSSFNTSNVNTMNNMFYSCTSLVKLDLSSFNTSNVKTMSEMFFSCTSLVKLDLSSFDTSQVTNMYYLFRNCTSLVEVDVTSFDTSQLNTSNGMFANCTSLVELDLSSFTISSKVKSLEMFKDISLKKLILGNNVSFNSTEKLGNPSPLDERPVTGNWIREDGKSKGYSPADFMKNYGTGDLTAGSYVAESVPKASLGVVVKFNKQSGEAIVGDEIDTTVTITHSKESENESVATKMSVDVTNIYSDSAVLIERLDSKGEVIKTSQKELVGGKLTLDNLNHGESYVLHFKGTAWNNVPKLDLWAYSVALSYFDGYDSMYTRKSGNYEVLSGPFGFTEVPELLTFTDTKLSGNLKEQLVDRQETDWSISLEDYRGTNSLSEPGAEPVVDRVDWEMTATSQGFKDSKGEKLPDGTLGIVFQKAGDSKELTAEETLIESHSVVGETPKDNHNLQLDWEETEGFKAIVHNRNGLKTEVDYKAQLDFELRVAP